MSDLIDRQAAIDAVRSYMADNWIEDSDWHANGIAYEIKRLPTAEPKTGMWESDRLVSTSGGTYGVRRCSECGAYYQDIGYGWNFCPTCGARMEGVDDGSN